MIFNVTGGGGAALNFKVQAYATEGELLAAAPAENTIGVITTTPLNGYAFSAEEPSPAEGGMVWITVGTSSQVAFSATKKNPVMVYPLAAKQYVSGAWVDVTCKSYQGGVWVDWIERIYLVQDGVPQLEYKKHHDQTVVTETTGYLELSSTGNAYHAIRFTVDIRGQTALNIEGVFSYYNTNISVWDVATSSPSETNTIATASVTDTTATLDISSLSDGQYIVGFTYRVGKTEKVSNFWLQ